MVIVLSASPNPSYTSNDRTHRGNNPLDSSGWELLAFGLVHQSHAQMSKVKGHSLQKSLSRVSPVLRELWSKGRKDEQSEEFEATLNSYKNIHTRVNQVSTDKQLQSAHQRLVL